MPTTGDFRVQHATCFLISNTDGAPASTGTGFLVGPRLVGTCRHVVDHADEGRSVIAQFFVEGRIQEIRARVLRTSDEDDAAVLELEREPRNITPLEFGPPPAVGAQWAGFGYPGESDGKRIPIGGTVRVSRELLPDDSVGLVLSADELAAGMGGPAHGFSGSPVTVNGKLVAHLAAIQIHRDLLKRAAAMDPGVIKDLLHELGRRPLWGIVYAVPVESIRKLMGEAVGAESAVVNDQIWKLQQARRGGGQQHLVELERACLRGEREPVIVNALADTLLALGEARRAHDVLAPLRAEGNTRSLVLSALATSRQGRLEHALDQLESLYEKAGEVDEVASILAGRHKQLWLRDRMRIEHLRRAYKLYESAWQLSLNRGKGDTYPGINMATTALWLGEPHRSREFARVMLDNLDPTDLWCDATEAEARLL